MIHKVFIGVTVVEVVVDIKLRLKMIDIAFFLAKYYSYLEKDRNKIMSLKCIFRITCREQKSHVQKNVNYVGMICIPGIS